MYVVCVYKCLYVLPQCMYLKLQILNKNVLYLVIMVEIQSDPSSCSLNNSTYMYVILLVQY